MWYKSVIPIWNHLKILQFISFQKPGFWFIEIDTKFIGEIWSGGSQKKWLHAIPNPESQIFMIFHDYLLSYIIRIMLKMRNSGKFGIRDRKLVKECGEQLLCIIESKILILFFSLFKVHMKRGVFEAVFVDALEPIAVTNIKKAVVATLNMDLSASR